MSSPSASQRKFTDIFVDRPVLAIVVSLVLLVLGLRSFGLLPVLQYPYTENAVVTVSTAYPGADANLVASFITTPLENAIAQANGIDYMTSASSQGVSTITANLRLNYDPNKALTEINTKVNSVLNQLPPQAQKPVLSVAVGQTIDAMYIGFYSDVLQPNQVTDYVVRAVQPKLQAVEGVQTAEILGAKNFALRAWLDPQKLAAVGLTAADVYSALAANNYLSASGQTKGQMVQVNLNASTAIDSLDAFKRLILKQSNGAIVRLEDVAQVSLGADDYDSSVSFDGRKAVYIGIQVAPGANLLDVIQRVRAVMPGIESQLPDGLKANIVYDSTKFVHSSIDEVVKTLGEAILIVTLVVFVFLGSLRAVVIPVIAIPLSLIGTFGVMLMLGYSINLLTLLAFVLAIGLVVDDAIIVVENVSRHLEEGATPFAAALQAARELASPILAMTVVLIAVYVPIGFMQGLTGALFTEFAFTLVGAVTMSAIIALTLSPMMCSKLLRAPKKEGGNWQDRLVLWLDRRFEGLHQRYQRRLSGVLNHLSVIAVFIFLMLGGIYFLYTTSMTELAPQEDQGVLISIAFNSPTATLAQRELYADQVNKDFASFPETDHVFQLNTPTQVISGMVLKPWDERSQTASQLQPLVQQKLAAIAGTQNAVFQPPSLPGARGFPVQFVITTTQPFDQLFKVANDFLAEALKSGDFIFLQTDLRIDLPQATVEINRSLAAQLGLNMQDIGSALSAMLSGGYVNYFELAGRSYKVIPQVAQQFRLNPADLKNYYLRASNGQMVPLSTVVSLKTTVEPEAINHFQQQNAATIQGVNFPTIPQGVALEKLAALAKATLPQGYNYDYAGPSRQFMQESGGMALTFLFAIIIIYLVLAAQFESFRDPVIILVSVPMSIAGALIFINLGIGRATLNIYTEVGLVTLIGLISKHGILIVEFANNLQKTGLGKRAAIIEAAGLRLRPILMTTFAMVLGVIPLIMATGAGAVSRFDLGLVIASGLGIGTFFTLFIVPGVYMLLGHDLSKSHPKADIPETA
ncbi:efflux RND transporter permease subunit [Halothiobacillus sp. DCM-1]|uniref:efflux RND transporter permease subunit n=1 Tax=Halothiobacillus sp. DCM-1 TaxID=3112558 RepID=UPI00324CC373